MLDKAKESLVSQTNRQKIVGSETFPLDSRLLDEAREITEQYFKKMASLSGRSKQRDQVYHLGVQFFSLTHNQPDP